MGANNIKVAKAQDFLKFNNTLVLNTALYKQLKSFIQKAKVELVNDNIDFLTKSNWNTENIKNCNFTIPSSKDLTKNALKLQKYLEQKSATLERNLTTEESFNEFMDTKNELEKFYVKISEEVKDFFLNPEEK